MERLGTAFNARQVLALETGGDHRDLHLVAHGFVQHHAEIDLHVVVPGGVADQRAGFVHFVQAQLAASR